MICYLDTSVVLRILFNESNPLPEWGRIEQGFSSRLLRLECFRSLHRDALARELGAEEIAALFEDMRSMLGHIGLLPITPRVLDRAEGPFGIPVGSLDAVHLATAVAWRELHGGDFLFATHDSQLGLAARAHGFTVIGI